MKKIKLSKNKWALVDNKDFNFINEFKWFYLEPGYAARTLRLKGNKFKKILMHRVLLNAPSHMEVDHINENKLDNRRKNIRLCTTAENRRNRKKPITNKSGYKGVIWHKHLKKWTSRINYNGQRYHLGYFDSKIAAARAYNNAAKKYHKQFANLNKRVKIHV